MRVVALILLSSSAYPHPRHRLPVHVLVSRQTMIIGQRYLSLRFKVSVEGIPYYPCCAVFNALCCVLAVGLYLDANVFRRGKPRLWQWPIGKVDELGLTIGSSRIPDLNVGAEVL